MAVADMHPSVADLEAFSLGTLPDAALATVEAHVANCPACQERAANAPGDSLVGLLRRIHLQSASRTTDTLPEAAQAPTPEPCIVESKAVTLVQADLGKRGSDTAIERVPRELVQHERYRVVRLLGEGGMGSVYEAEHCVMQRAVALKVINAAFTARPATVERFRREVRAAARLSHPNIVTTYDAEDAGTTLFLVMEYVEGVSLAQLVKQRGPLPIAEACDYLRQAALGLQHAHERGMVHRDVKPHNLIRAKDGQVKVLDFGLAALTAERSGELTDENAVMGTPDYMAPEQAADARSADIRADVYSLGCTLYYMLTGSVPYPASTTVLKIIAHREQALPSLRPVRPEVPAELGRVLARLLAKKPADRYQTPAEVAAALAPFADAQRPGAKPGGKRGWFVAAAALLLLAAGIVVYRIQTDRGELVITTESDDVEVIVKQGGKLVEIIDTKTNKRLTLRSGVYDLELKGGKGLKLDLDKVTLTRAGTVLARIERDVKPAPPVAQPVAKDAIGLVHRVDWRTDGMLYPSVAARGRYFLCQVVSGGPFPRGARVWDGETGKFLWDHNNSHGAQFSPDGELVYVLERDPGNSPSTRPEKCVIRAYRTATGELVRTIGRTPGFTHVFFLSADGKYLCTNSGDLWNVADGKLLRKWGANESFAGFSPDSKHITITREGEPRRLLYRLPTFEEVPQPEPLAAFASIDWQPSGKYAIAAEPKMPIESSWLIEADGRKLHRWLPRSYGKCLDQAHWINGREALVGLDDGTLRLFDVVTQQERSRFQLPPGEKAERFQLSSDRTFVAAITTKGAIILFRLPEQSAAQEPTKIKTPTGPQSLKVVYRLPWPGRSDAKTCFSDDGRLCAAWTRDAMRVFDTETGRMVQEFIGLPQRTLNACFLPDGKQVLTSHTDGSLRRWDVASGKRAGQFSTELGWPLIQGISPDGESVGVHSGPVQIWNLKTGKRRFSVEPEREKEFLTASSPVSPDGKRLLTVDSRGAEIGLRTFEVASGKRLMSNTVKVSADVHGWSADNQRLYLHGGEAGQHVIGCVDANTGKLIATVPLTPQPGASYGRKFSHDARYFGVQYPAANLVHVYDTRTGQLAFTANGPNPEFSLSFAPDGRYFACGGLNEVVLYRLP